MSTDIRHRYIVSYPRSGQHLLASVFERIASILKMNFKYCNTYNCTGDIPCKCNPTLQKWHDFDLMSGKKGIDIEEHCRYLVLYRNDRIENLEAYYRFLRRHKTYSVNDFLSFYKSKYNYYDIFFNKWVKSKNDSVFTMDYNSFINNPDIFISKAFIHLHPDYREKMIPTITEFRYKAHGEYGLIGKKHTMNHLLYNHLVECVKTIDEMNVLPFEE